MQGKHYFFRAKEAINTWSVKLSSFWSDFLEHATSWYEGYEHIPHIVQK